GPFISARPQTKLNMLVLGGTNFVGPSIVRYATRRGHNVYLFNRGLTNPGLFPKLPLFKGDRNEGAVGYRSLKDKFWDVIIDTWPERSELVKEATSQLQGATKHYLFISSISVYNDFSEIGIDENSPTVSTGIPTHEWQYPEHKKTAEELVREAFPQKHTIFRPGPIKGWRDPSNDLAYWLVRIRRGGVILGPADGMDPIQFIDVSDLAQFVIRTAEQGLTGTFNTTGPLSDGTLHWKTLLAQAQKKINKDAEIKWNNAGFLKEHAVEPLSEMPLWLPVNMDPGFMQISARKALMAGLQLRPVHRTFRDVLSWFDLTYPPDFKFGEGGEKSPGLPREKEKDLINTIS
ncbi:MAG: NAD-dependent epimerase/dehydratase family protein, partial [Saprospiraceae bacterium]|nr:NAD-dependent epimerase/dehydratase family protein [Saprospiraceae bacterium]